MKRKDDEKFPLTPGTKEPKRAPIVPPVIPDREAPLTSGDLPEETVYCRTDEPETGAVPRGEPSRESDETF